MSRARNSYRLASYWTVGRTARVVDPTAHSQGPPRKVETRPAVERPVDALRHGYTLVDLHQLARLAVHTAGKLATDWQERYDTAWSAIAEHLYAAPHWPQRHDLVRAGQLAVYAAIDDDRQAYGYYRRKTDGAQHGAFSSPAFRTYWWDLCGAMPARSPEGPIVERHTVAAILPLLSAGQREALMALAAHEDYRAAADALGMTYVTYKSQVARARNRFLAYWHEGEAPSKVWGCDRRAGRTAADKRAGGTGAESIRRRARAATRRAAA